MRRVFLASSTEALGQLYQIAAAIKDECPDVEIELWEHAFPAGVITFPRIEEISREVSGAVILASPDDKTVIRRKTRRVPRSNVILELGYLSAVLGLRRTAICKYTEAELPTDLRAVNFIDMGPYPHQNPGAPLTSNAESSIRKWAREQLHHLALGLPAADVLHGYAGRWESELKFSRWRDFDCTSPTRTVYGLGRLDLLIPPDGKGGCGCEHGELYISIDGCRALFKLTDRISNVNCESDGTLQFESETHTRQLIEIKGNPPLDDYGSVADGFEQKLSGTGRFKWVFSPDPMKRGVLHGMYVTRDQVNGKVRSMAEVSLKKINRSWH